MTTHVNPNLALDFQFLIIDFRLVCLHVELLPNLLPTPTGFFWQGARPAAKHAKKNP